jgi:hypothetical protein
MTREGEKASTKERERYTEKERSVRKEETGFRRTVR